MVPRQHAHHTLSFCIMFSPRLSTSGSGRAIRTMLFRQFEWFTQAIRIFRNCWFSFYFCDPKITAFLRIKLLVFKMSHLWTWISDLLPWQFFLVSREKLTNMKWLHFIAVLTLLLPRPQYKAVERSDSINQIYGRESVSCCRGRLILVSREKLLMWNDCIFIAVPTPLLSRFKYKAVEHNDSTNHIHGQKFMICSICCACTHFTHFECLVFGN